MSEIGRRQTVLIVDDMPENISILGELLKDDYTIRVATSGEKALKIARSETPPDLILLDIVMPGMDGYEVCTRLKTEISTKDIPVIFITSKDTETDEIRGFKAGAVDYVTKPFSPIVVRARVNTHAELKKYRDLLEDSSYMDGLTGLANRRKLDEYSKYVWEYALRNSMELSAIMIDVDCFKLYNDNYGHQHGDVCLKRVAEVLGQGVRRKVDLICRFGGEEFLCLLPNTSIAAAEKKAEDLRQAVLSLEIPHPYSKAERYLTISLGVSTAVATPDKSIDLLISEADKALYQSKGEGRNRVTSRTF